MTTPSSEDKPAARPASVVAGWLSSLSVAEVAVACGVALLALHFLLPQEVFFSPDEGMRLVASRSLTLEGVWSGVIHYPSRALDPRAEFVPYFPEWFKVTAQGDVALDRRIVWFAALIAPLQQIGGVGLARAFSVLCGVLAGWLAGWVVQSAAGVGAGRVAVLIVALGVPSSLYALLLWEHQLALTLVLAALACYVKLVHNARPAWAVAGGVALLAACALRPETLLAAAPGLAIAALAQARVRLLRLAPVVGGGLLLVIAVGIYLLAGQDVPARLPRLFAALPSPERLLLAFERVFVGYQASPVTTGAWILLALLAVAASGITARGPRAQGWVLSAALWSGTFVAVLSLLRVDPFQVTNPGLLSPLVLVTLVGMFWRGGTLRLVHLTIYLALLGLVLSAALAPNLIQRAGSVVTQVGSTWGSRYLLALYPLAAVGALALVGAQWRQGGVVLRLGLVAALAAGALTNLVGYERIRQDTTRVQALCQSVWATRAEVVITSEWWLAVECAADARVRFLHFGDPARAGALTRLLFENERELPAGARVALVWREHADPIARLSEALPTCFSTEQESARSAPVSLSVVTLTGRTERCAFN